MSTENKPQYISTEMLAEVLCINPGSIRVGLCRNKGKHYLGLKPIKLPNRRLLWPADAVELIISTAGKVCDIQDSATEPMKAHDMAQAKSQKQK